MGTNLNEIGTTHYAEVVPISLSQTTKNTSQVRELSSQQQISPNWAVSPYRFRTSQAV